MGNFLEAETIDDFGKSLSEADLQHLRMVFKGFEHGDLRVLMALGIEVIRTE